MTTPSQPAEVVKLDLSAGSIHTKLIDGQPHVILKPAVDDLGLAYSPQLRKLKSRSWGVVTETVTTGADGKAYTMAATTVRSFLMLMANVNENRVADDVRPTLVAFQTETADAIEAYWTRGGAIKPNAPLPQLDVLKEQVESQREARLREMSDYRAVTRAISGAGGDREDFRDVQDFIYLELFGMSAETIRKRQPQVNGKRYKRDSRHGKVGELIRSGVAKDHLTEAQLKRLDAMVLAMSSLLVAWHPDGMAPLSSIHDAVQESARAISRGPKSMRGAA
ncbi:phage antirepressor N-terminal domain-containing protein [Streptomyces sp. NPDC050704]|uniref:phage antirepressor N-terminal domain-containing protein n=1 Tax=Streptomyces sp. NPDC050704 TaxID=3157219 RepID=UPI0034255549